MNISISEILNEWQQNSRFRLGIWLILAILLTYALLLFSDWEKTIQNDCQSLINHLKQLEILTQQKEWKSRADAAQAFNVQMEGKLWRANSQGLAQAKVQIWIDNLLKEKNLTDARTQVEPTREITGYEGIWQVGARMEGNSTIHQISDLLYAIESHNQLVAIEQFDLIYTDKIRFTLVIKVYFQANAS